MNQKIEESRFLFKPFNYVLLALALVSIVLGYLLMLGGGSSNPNQFNSELFNTQRIRVAPALIVFGLIIAGLSIMMTSSKNK